MLKIRLARVGRKNDPSYRVVVTEHTRGPKSGNHIEVLGNYNPKVDNVTLDGERIKHWISVGAQVSDTVHNILVGQGIIEGKKINVLPKKSPIVKEVEEAEATPEVSAETEGATADETPSEETKEEAPDEEAKEEPKEETKEEPKEEVKAEVKEEPATEEEKKEE